MKNKNINNAVSNPLSAEQVAFHVGRANELRSAEVNRLISMAHTAFSSVVSGVRVRRNAGGQ